jgi:O-antigen/teichoic acid export membrane protein
MHEIRPASPPPTGTVSTPSAFARAWRWLLPIAVAIMVAAAAFGVVDTTAASAWIFAAGALVGLVGVVSLATHFFDLGRREVRALEKRLEDELERRGNGRS